MAAVPIALLRSQSQFLELLALCVQSPVPNPSNPSLVDGEADGEHINELVNAWQSNVDVAWRLAAESHALTILNIEAFSQPRQSGIYTLQPCPCSDWRAFTCYRSHAVASIDCLPAP